MSRAEDYLHAVNDQTFASSRFGEDSGVITDLLLAVADAWQQAEATPISENEAQRWSRVCSAASKVVGL